MMEKTKNLTIGVTAAVLVGGALIIGYFVGPKKTNQNTVNDLKSSYSTLQTSNNAIQSAYNQKSTSYDSLKKVNDSLSTRVSDLEGSQYSYGNVTFCLVDTADRKKPDSAYVKGLTTYFKEDSSNIDTVLAIGMSNSLRLASKLADKEVAKYLPKGNGGKKKAKVPAASAAPAPAAYVPAAAPVQTYTAPPAADPQNENDGAAVNDALSGLLKARAAAKAAKNK